MSRTIEVSEETFQKIKNQLAEDDKTIDDLQDIVGEKVFFRTVTYHVVGKVSHIVYGGGGVVLVWLDQASWIPDSGRFMQFIKDGQLNEVEPVGKWFVNLATVTDGGIWKHSLPKEQK